MITARIEGHVIGMTWGSGRCSMAKNFSVSRANRKGRKLPDLVRDMLSNCGDFQGEVKLTADTVLTLTTRKVKTNKIGFVETTRERVIQVTELPSLAGLVDPNFYADEFGA